MPIAGIDQPALIQVDENLRLRKYDGVHQFAFSWYQDEETVYMVDGRRAKYSMELLDSMYRYLDEQGELYFIEVLEAGVYRPIGDVTFWKDDMPIVIGEKKYRGRGLAQKVINALISRGKALGYGCLFVREIYSFNFASQHCFERAGFRMFEQTESGFRYQLLL